jgi:erythromycin esterase-like protein
MKLWFRQDESLIDAVRLDAQPLSGAPGDHDALLASIGSAHLVLLGEASHGTHEFYEERARITRRLIEEKDFDAVAIEGDWPDAWRVNRHVRGDDHDATAAQALSGFRRFPAWMWRNTVVAEFVDWQRRFNASRPVGQRSGFYGLDLYSMQASMRAVLDYLERERPQLLVQARERYACFDRFGDDTQAYGLMTGLGDLESCEEEVVAMLIDLRRESMNALTRDGSEDVDEVFNAETNAHLVKNAEQYYRTMMLSDVSSWNLRDTHMMETLESLRRHLHARNGRPPKIVVWAHNSHLGDAAATQMGERGELNLGQLVRTEHGHDSFSLGFTTHSGSVTAASDWEGPAERKKVRPSLAGSHEAILHETGIDHFLLPLRTQRQRAAWREPLLERAIGVIYRPATERESHYFFARITEQFDALIHIDETRALVPLDRNAEWRSGEAPETYPSGL